MSTTYAISKAVMRLQRRFPLRPIRNDKEYNDATTVLAEFLMFAGAGFAVLLTYGAPLGRASLRASREPPGEPRLGRSLALPVRAVLTARTL